MHRYYSRLKRKTTCLPRHLTSAFSLMWPALLELMYREENCHIELQGTAMILLGWYLVKNTIRLISYKQNNLFWNYHTKYMGTSTLTRKLVLWLYISSGLKFLKKILFSFFGQATGSEPWLCGSSHLSWQHNQFNITILIHGVSQLPTWIWPGMLCTFWETKQTYSFFNVFYTSRFRS